MSCALATPAAAQDTARVMANRVYLQVLNMVLLLLGCWMALAAVAAVLIEPARGYGDELREDHQDDDEGRVGGYVAPHAPATGFHLDARHAGHHVQHGDHGRRPQPHAAHQHEHPAEIGSVVPA